MTRGVRIAGTVHDGGRACPTIYLGIQLFIANDSLMGVTQEFVYLST
jgi:hypothetical protein